MPRLLFNNHTGGTSQGFLQHLVLWVEWEGAAGNRRAGAALRELLRRAGRDAAGQGSDLTVVAEENSVTAVCFAGEEL